MANSRQPLGSFFGNGSLPEPVRDGEGAPILGLAAGLIARALLPGRDPLGLIATLLIGMAGAVVGGILSEALGFGGLGSFYESRTWIITLAGSAVLLILVRMARGGRRPVT